MALDRVAAAADRAGIDRRQFLQTSAGVAAVLVTFNACSDGGETAPSSTTRGSPRTTAGGSFEVPEPEDVKACEEALAGDEFIFDIHTHHVVPDGPWRQNALRIADMILGLVPSGCEETDPYRCLDRTAYLHDMFLASDTTVSLLSDVPNSGPMDAPVPWEEKRETKQLADALAVGGHPRVLLHDVLAPNFGELAMRLDEMEANAGTGDLSAFKVYTAWGPDGRGYALDDPAIGLPVVEKARSLGVKVMCAHKGLPLLEFDRSHNGPEDVVAVAKQYPDMDFVVYHGAYELQTTEGPYDPADAARGVNSLIKALDDHGIPPNANVHAELGTTWRETLGSPTEAAHMLGKLLARVGSDNVMWGTDAVWYGSPQPQIMAFRSFQIAPELQERHGYPALTPELKAKIFGLNAARVFGIDPEGARCALDADGLAEARAQLATYRADGAIQAWQPRGPLTRREVRTWLANLKEPWTPA
jgi:predicted TIM-barrel fold metal-dependent hydrolase